MAIDKRDASWHFGIVPSKDSSVAAGAILVQDGADVLVEGYRFRKIKMLGIIGGCLGGGLRIAGAIRRCLALLSRGLLGAGSENERSHHQPNGKV